MSDEGEKPLNSRQHDQSGLTSKQRHRRDKRLVAVLLIIVGVLLMVFGGGCSAMFLGLLASEYGWDSQILLLLLIPIALFGAGLLIFRKGTKLSRRP